MSLFKSYRLRLRRKRFQLRARRRSRDLICRQDRTNTIAKDAVILVLSVRNERLRLPFFLSYYRDMGIGHFLVIDNDSDDGTGDYLSDQPDVSLWHSTASYKEARFGVDWQNYLLSRYAHGHWVLVVDVDEFFVYPFCDTRPIHALTDWLDASAIRTFGTMLLDLYARNSSVPQPYQEGQNPLEITAWFDSGNYTIKRNPEYQNLWVQGGPRSRVFFADDPKSAPALNKIPLVKWDRRYVYVSSTHMMLPRGLNLVYDEWGGEKASGVLLHAKFIDTFAAKAQEELERREHYASSAEYIAYVNKLRDHPNLWCEWSEKYINWRQLEILGLMSKGNWA